MNAIFPMLKEEADFYPIGHGRRISPTERILIREDKACIIMCGAWSILMGRNASSFFLLAQSRKENT